MRLKTIYNCCDKVAPFRLSKEYCEKYGAYDNSGIMLDSGEEIKGVLFSLDLTLRAVERAKQTGANLIITHHPAIYAPIKGLGQDNAVSRALVACARAGISVLSSHLNLDCAEGGIDECLMLALGGSEPTCMHPLSGGAYGRVYEVNTSVEGVVKTLKEQFQARRILTYGEEKPLKKIASFCGAGLDDETLEFARREGAQAIVSSDSKHHLITAASELSIALILPTHYAVERYGFEKFYEKIKRELDVPSEFLTDERFL